MSNVPSFENWFDRLTRHKMHGAALATASIAVGILVMGASIPLKQPAGDIVLAVGVVQVAASSLLFVAFTILQFHVSLKDALSFDDKSKTGGGRRKACRRDVSKPASRRVADCPVAEAGRPSSNVGSPRGSRL